MTDPRPDTGARATVVIVPRERYGEAEASLANILEEVKAQHADLVYISGRAPRALLEAVDSQAARHGFRHIQVDRILAPNEARNIGVRAATTPYVVFVDNDVFGAPGWLAALVDCAEATGADVITPLTCHGPRLHEVIHQAGGEFAPDPQAFFQQPHGRRVILEVMNHQDARVSEIALARTETQLCEFHCVLARRSVFDRLGPLDEGLLATKEHLDFCMTVIRAGGKVMFEPKSVLTYVFPNRHSPMQVRDWPFFLVRWSPEWQRRSLRRFQEKWGLADDGYLRMRAGMLSWRHNEGIIKASLRKVPVLGRRDLFIRAGRKMLSPVVRGVSRVLVAREDRLRSRPPGNTLLGAGSVQTSEG
jgi:glycosyltransferase involved in cell wall biosynthesis